MKKILSLLVILALVGPYALVPSSARAADGTLTVLINGAPPTGHCVAGTITVSGSGTTGQQGGTWHLSIDWGDGSPITTPTILTGSLTKQGNQVSAFTYTASHSPVGVSTGITVTLYHSQPSGQDGQVIVINQCTAPPTQGVVIIEKHVVNNEGGSSAPSNFTLHIGSQSFAGSENGTDILLDAGNYTLSETPVAGYVGTIGGDCAANGSITVVAGENYLCTITNDDIFVNSVPVANNSNVVTNEDTSVGGNLSASDVDGDTLTYATTTNPSNGTLVLNSSTGAFTYTPNANYNGPDSFNFKVNDGTADSNVATVSITVNSVNDNPVLDLGTTTALTIDELTNVSFTSSATDTDLDTLEFDLSGTVPAGATINPSTGVFSWTPTEAQGPGVYVFNVVVSDGNSGSDSEQITITVNEVNVAPVTTGASVSTHQNSPELIVLSASDSDLPANILTYTIVSAPTNGTLGSILGNQVTYTPNANYVGPDSFTFKVNDGTVDSNVSVINIDVSDTAPDLDFISDKVIDEMVPFSFTLTATDPESDPLTFSVTSSATGFTVDANTGLFSWTPSEVQDGIYNFLATVTAGAQSDSQSFQITVNEVNIAPVAVDDSVTTDEDTAVSGTLSATDADLPANTLTYVILSNPANGTITAFDGTTGDFTYTPNANYNGADSFTFTANDGTTDGNTATVSITVDPVNDPPTVTLIGSDPISFVATTTPFVDPGATGDDVEDGALVPVVTGTVDEDTPGTYNLVYTVTDSDNASASTTRAVIVTAVPVENTLPLCTDGIDNDNDGLIDLADPDCAAYIPPPPPPPAPPTPPGGGGGGGNGPIAGSFGVGGGGSVLGASTVGEVLGESCGLYMNKHLRLGSKKNDAEQVRKLQEFLNRHIGSRLPITGFYGNLTVAAVKDFQVRYLNEVLKPWNLTSPTGLVYISTLRQINNIECPDIVAQLPPLIPWSQNPNAQ